MDVVYKCCAGLDVHKKTIAVCAVWRDNDGARQQQVRTFSTMTAELLAMSDWLADKGVTHVAMESTGVYWKPIFNILEGRFQVLLVNARHIKQVPGRKTDVKDCEWIGQLLEHGLLTPSYVPSRAQRDLRDLTRHRAQLMGEHTRVANRIHKVLEDANVKLSSVATDILGVSGREILQALIAGEQDAERMANLARKRLRNKQDQLKLALQGHVTDHHRFMLKMLLDHLRTLEGLVGQLDKRIEELMRPFQEQIERLSAIPGVKDKVAQVIIAEMGVDMSVFPSADHLASWAGLCSGNNESAGKRKSGRTTRGNRWLRRALSQAAWAAAPAKKSYLSAQFRRIARRKGRKRAIVAVGHTILTTVYHMLKNGTVYSDLGPDYLDRRKEQHLKRSLVRRLEKLGYRVELHSDAEAA